MSKKVIGKFISLAIVALVVVVMVGCAGPSGSTGPQGPQGPQGLQGIPGPPGEVVICKACITVVPTSGEPKAGFVVYGAGFVPGEEVVISSCVRGVTRVLAATGTGGVVVVNEYGAFKLKPRGGIPRPEAVPAGVYVLKAEGNKGSMALVAQEILEKS